MSKRPFLQLSIHGFNAKQYPHGDAMTSFKLSLRLKVVFVVLVVLIAVAASIWPAMLICRNHYQHGVKQALSDLNGRVSWGGRNFSFNFSRQTTFDDSALRRVLQVTDGKIYSLNISDTSVTDDGVHCLAGLHELNSLDLSCTKITDQGVACLQDLPQLECLNLAHTKVRGTTLNELEKFSKLELLNLAYSNVDDSGMTQIAKLRQLRILDLSGLSVSMAGLKQLASVWRLQHICLYDTSITEDQSRELEQLFQATIEVGVLRGKGGGITQKDGEKNHVK